MRFSKSAYTKIFNFVTEYSKISYTPPSQSMSAVCWVMERNKYDDIGNTFEIIISPDV